MQSTVEVILLVVNSENAMIKLKFNFLSLCVSMYSVANYDLHILNLLMTGFM